MTSFDQFTIENEAKVQKGGFFGMLLGTLGASLLVIMLAVKGVIQTGKLTIRASGSFQCCLIL